MGSFFELLKKEIRELLTKQLILPFVIMMLVFMFIGYFIEGEVEKSQTPIPITIVDLDQSELTKAVPPLLEEAGYDVDIWTEGNLEELKENISSDVEFNSYLVFPENFEEDLTNGERVTIPTYTLIDSFSTVNIQRTASVESIVQSLNEVVSLQLIADATDTDDPTFYKKPIVGDYTVEVNGTEVRIKPSLVMNYILSQVALIPVILFLVITVAAQLVATAVATEKENKTLETLLATPISRKAIVAAKLLAAGLVSLMIALFYMLGLRNLNSSLTGGESVLAEDSASAIDGLGLQFSSSDFLILGLVIFLGILVALSLAFILGSFANDSRSAQSVIAPVMLMLLVPYLLTMFIDINTASTWVKIALYAIPFTYTFTAASNLMLDNYPIIIFGIFYNIVLISIFVVIASKIFTTEKILTLKFPQNIFKR